MRSADARLEFNWSVTSALSLYILDFHVRLVLRNLEIFVTTVSVLIIGLYCEPTGTHTYLPSMAYYMPKQSNPDVPALTFSQSSSTDDQSLGSNDFTTNSMLPMGTWSGSPDPRCSRCRETASDLPRFAPLTMLRYALNLWYCPRCAGFVGWKPR